MRNTGTALWQGFDIEWARTPHRLKHLASAIDRLDADGDALTGVVRSRLTVGKVPDRGVVRTRVAGLRSSALRFQEGEAQGHVEARQGEKARFVGERVVVDVSDAAPDSATAVLRGFELGCTTHDGGIHPQGLSVGLTELAVHDGQLSFVPRAWVKANNSPDLVTGWRDTFAFDFRVLYTVIVGSDAAIHHRAEPCAQVEHTRRTRADAQVRHRGRGGFNRAAVGVRGFRWDQRHQGWFQRNGRFVRRLQAHLGDHRYDPESGDCEVQPALHFSNDGLVPYPVRSEHRLWTTLIEYRDDRPELPATVIEQPIATGLEEAADELPFRLESTREH